MALLLENGREFIINSVWLGVYVDPAMVTLLFPPEPTTCKQTRYDEDDDEVAVESKSR